MERFLLPPGATLPPQLKRPVISPYEPPGDLRRKLEVCFDLKDADTIDRFIRKALYKDRIVERVCRPKKEPEQ